MTFLSRLVFGCGRLTGGASRVEGMDLLARVFDAGVLAVDVAPSYGMGTAEAVVGEAVSRWHGPRIEIVAKSGIEPPRFAYARTLLRAAKRIVRSPEPRDLAAWQPVEPQARFGQGQFSPQAMAASVARSRELLPHIDRLLLHGCGPDECTPDVQAALDALARPLDAQPGYAIAARFDEACDARYPPHYFAETAIDPALLAARRTLTVGKTPLFHSLVPTATWLEGRDPQFRSDLAARSARLGRHDPATARVAAIFALAAERVVDARFVFSSTDAVRLGRLLAALTDIAEQPG